MTAARGAVSREGLVAANAEFYESFEARSLDRMDAVWDHSEDVYCVHPGGELIAGWRPVRRSWAALFTSTSYLQFIVTDVRARPGQDFGVVTCTENVLTGGRDDRGFGAGKAMATNVFRWRGGAWRMVAHHASPVMTVAQDEGRGGSE